MAIDQTANAVQANAQYLAQGQAMVSVAQQIEQAVAGQLAVFGSMQQAVSDLSSVMQSLPGQLSDLSSALQSGSAAGSGFLEFGNQIVGTLADSSGAIGNVGVVVADLVMALGAATAPFAVVTAAVVGLSIAYNEGSKENDAYRKALVLTGNEVGTTVDQMHAMAASIDGVVGTHGKAAESLAIFASQSATGSATLEQYTQVAIGFERAAGQAVSETAKQFASLQGDPLNAVMKLNSGMNFLTDSTYAQIKSLQEQGLVAEAAEVAQGALAGALSDRTKELEANLGTIERAWRGIKEFISEIGDGLKSIGRDAGMEGQYAAQQKIVEHLQSQVDSRKSRNLATGDLDRQLDAANNRLSELSAQVGLNRMNAQLEAERAARVKARAEVEKDSLKYLTQEEKIRRQILSETQKIRESYKGQTDEESVGRMNAEIAARKKAIEDSVAKPGSIRSQPRASSERSDYEAVVSGLQKKIEVEQRGVVVEAQLTESQRKRKEYIDGLQEALGKLTPKERESAQALILKLQTLGQTNDAERERIKAIEEASKAEEKVLADRQKSAEAVEKQVEKMQEEQKANSYAAAQKISLAQAIEEVNLARLREEQTIQLAKGADGATLLAIQREIAARERVIGLIKTKEAGEKDKTAAAAADAATKETAKKAQAEWEKVSDGISKSLTDAFMNSFTTGKSLAKGLREALKEQFNSLVLRPTINAVMKPIAGLLTGALGLAETASAGTSAASSLGSLASGASLLGSASTLGAGIANGLSAWSAGGSVMGVLSNPGLYTMAELAGVLGPIALGIAALVAISQETKGELRSGGQFGIAYDGSVTNQRRGQTYTYEGQQYDRDFSNGERKALVNGQAYRLEGDPVNDEASIKKAITGTATSINELLKMYGSRSSLTSFSAGFETSGKSRGGVFAGGILSTGERFGESGQGDNYAQTLYELTSTNSPDYKTAVENFTTDLQQATLQALKAATDLPKYVSRQLKDVDIEALGATETTALLSKIGDLPNQLLQSFGTSRDALVQQFAQGLAGGDAAAAGETVANTLVASIEQTLFTTAAGRIFDTVNAGIIAPMLDAITTGANISEVLSQESIDRTIARAQEQAEAVTLLFNSPDFVAAMERIRTTVGGALGQAGSGVNYTPRYQASAAASGSSGISTPSELTRAYENAVKSLKSGSQDLGVELLSAKGDEEGAKALQKSLDRTRFMEQFEAFEEKLDDTRRKEIETLYDANEATRAYIQGIKDAAQAQLDALTRQRDSAVQMIDTATSNTDAAFARFEAATNKEKERLQLVIDAARGVFDAAKEAASSLFGEVESVVQSQGLQGRDFIGAALLQAQSTGELPDGEELTKAIDSVGKDLAATTFSSQAEGDYQRLVLANELKGLQDISGDQLTEAERQVEKLDKDLEQGREMISAMRGIDTGVGTLSETLVALIGAYNQESRIRSNVAAQGALGKDGAYYNYKTGSGLNSSGVYFEGAAIREAAGIALEQGATAKDIYDVIAGSGFSLAQAEAILGATPGSFEEIAKQMDWPIFHRGTRSVPRTGFALLQQGEAVIPAAYNPFTAGRGWSNSSDMLTAMEGVRAELIEVRRQNDALQRAALRTADAVNGRPEAPMLVENV